uniref:Uncharacterized protein n=1 Tax=Phytophthora fragariae TaxID=53985 RepID=A0A6A3DKC5_9STRA|nr:hypothetical protein PF009_g29556 [Phytophthora fragariae]
MSSTSSGLIVVDEKVAELLKPLGVSGARCHSAAQRVRLDMIPASMSQLTTSDCTKYWYCSLERLSRDVSASTSTARKASSSTTPPSCSLSEDSLDAAADSRRVRLCVETVDSSVASASAW